MKGRTGKLFNVSDQVNNLGASRESAANLFSSRLKVLETESNKFFTDGRSFFFTFFFIDAFFDFARIILS